MFHNMDAIGTNHEIFYRRHKLTSQGIVDVAVDPNTNITITVGLDKKISTFDTAAGNLLRSFKLNGDFGDPMKVNVDPSGTYLVCSCSDKSISLIDLSTGQLVAQAMGHSEVVTAAIFLPDCRHLVSVGGDGCIFIWKLPTTLSTTMQQKVGENSCPLSATTKNPPVALCQVKFQGKNDSECKVSHLDTTFKASNDIVRRQSSPSTSCQKISTFKFSISKLPRWAQMKVTNPELNSFQAEENASVRAEFKTPSNYKLNGCKLSCNSTSRSSIDSINQSSQMVQHSSYALDRRWLTIHTVCLDLLNSPADWDIKDTREAVPVTHMCAKDGLKANTSSSYDFQLEIGKTCCKEAGAAGQVRDVKFDPFESINQPIADNASTFTSCMDNKISILDTGNVSVKSEVYQENLTESLKNPREARHHKNSDGFAASSSSGNVDAIDVESKNELDSGKTKREEMVVACREELLSLNAAAGRALQLFTALEGLTSVQEISKGPEAQLCAEAAEMLPSVAKKVHAVAKMVQTQGHDSFSDTGVISSGDAASFEPLLGKFAESLSHRVVEILKEKC